MFDALCRKGIEHVLGLVELAGIGEDANVSLGDAWHEGIEFIGLARQRDGRFAVAPDIGDDGAMENHEFFKAALPHVIEDGIGGV